MNFVQFVEDLRTNLNNTQYVEMIWDQIRGREYVSFASLEDQEVYEHHIPLDFKSFLKNCVSKLRLIKNNKVEVNMSVLDEKYICTLIYYALEQEDAPMENKLYAADLYFLLNLLNIPNKKFFYEVIYNKIVHALQEYRTSQDITNRTIMFVMDDLKLFLSKRNVPDSLLQTIALLCDYSYFNNEHFETINPDVSFENLGYIAFVTLKILTDQLTQRSNRDKTLFILLLGMVQDLISSHTRNYSSNVILAHQYNVRLFIRENFQAFASPTCIVTKILRSIQLNSDFDNYEGAACIMEELPILAYQDAYGFVLNALDDEKLEKLRINLFNYIVPLIRHPHPGDPEDKRILRMKLLIYTILKVFMKPNAPEDDIVRIISECSECPLGIKALQEIFIANGGLVNKSTIMELLYSKADTAWSKKQINISYVNLMCNLYTACPEQFGLKLLNQLRSICITGAPFDLKSCIPYYKRVLIKHSTKIPLVIYFLDFFIKLMFHPQETSIKFAKELFELIFSNVTANDNGENVWNIVDCLFCNCFDSDKIFDKFNSLGLLKPNHVKILLDHKIKLHKHRKSALKLLLAILNHINYNETTILDHELQSWLSQIDPVDKDFNVMLCSLIKMLGRKQRNNCTDFEIVTYRRLQLSVYHSFCNQMFPNDCITSAIQLLKEYARLLEEGQQWSHDVFLRTEESLHTKLMSICEMKSVNPANFMKDVTYIIKFITFGKEELGDHNLAQLEKIVHISDQLPQFTVYLWSHQEIFLMCILLYTNVCLVNSTLIINCVKCLEHISKVSNLTNSLKLQIMFSLYDVCKLHLQYFEPLIPFLFDTIFSKSAYLRFSAMSIIIQLVSDKQLRLVDGQYFSFMGLLSDRNVLIKQHTEIFLEEKFVPLYHLIVATHFVPGIIHFNHFYDHPAVSLTAAEQVMLKQRTYTFQNRCCIYYHLYRFLPENVKFNILKQISLEILMRIISKSIPFSTKLLPILFDALVVIMFTIPNNKKQKNMDLFYNNGLEKVKNELLVNSISVQKTFQEHQLILGGLLTPLFHILYGELNEHSDVCQNVLFTIISLTNEFFDVIKHIITEDRTLKKLYVQLEPFFKKMQHHFAFKQLSVNPGEFESLSQKQNYEFYLHGMSNFKLISEAVVTTFNRPL